MKSGLIIFLLSVCWLSAQIPITWQTSEQDLHITVEAGQPDQIIELAWPLTESTVAGQWFRVRCGSLNYLSVLKYCSVSDASGNEFQAEYQHSQEAQNKDWGYFVANPFLVGWKSQRAFQAGQKLSFKGVFKSQSISGISYFFRLETAETWEGPWRSVSPWAIVRVASANPEYIRCILNAAGKVTVLYTDRFGNPATPKSPVSVVLKAPDDTAIDTLTVQQSAATSVVQGSPSEIPYVKVADSNGLTAVSNIRMVSAIDHFPVWYGDLHFHTEFSGDGVRPIPDALESARDQLAHDFAACTDHMIFSNHYKPKDYFDLIDRYNEDGRFVTLPACEVSCPQGHVNLYFRNRQSADRIDAVLNMWVRSSHWGKPHRLNFEPLFNAYSATEIIVVPHHTNTTSGAVVNRQGLAFWRNFDWRAVDTRYSPIAEIVQLRGSFETESVDPEWRVIAGGYGSSLRSALARGLRIGFIGGTDNHFGWPSREPAKADFAGLTGIYAKELTRQALFEALQSRRTFATSGVPIAVEFTLNNRYPMGSIVAQTPKEKRSFTVRVAGTAVLERAEIVSQGAVLAQLSCDGSRELNTLWTDPRPDAPLDDCYYYLRVRQVDGHCAWTSPIWVDYASEE